MKLSVKQRGNIVNDLTFTKGPIYIGRQIGSQVFLVDTAVSRQHAVIYTTESEGWVIEDLDSSNKTYLNGAAIHKSELKNGDTIRIANFRIDVILDDQNLKDIKKKKQIHLEDTIISSKPDTQQHDFPTVVHRIGQKDAPAITLPNKRMKDFCQATRTINRVASFKELHHELLDIILRQFLAREAWAALWKDPNEEVEIEGGRKISRQTVKRSELVLESLINEAIDKQKFILVPELPRKISGGTVRSGIIAPIIRDKKCYGVVYADNSGEHEHYNPSDLDYMMLLTIHTAAVMENL